MDYDGFSQQQLDALFFKMIEFNEGDPKRIQHLAKVHSFARIMGIREQLDANTLFILEAAAYVHDIGRCMYCDLCLEGCNFGALKWDQNYEGASYFKEDFIYDAVEEAKNRRHKDE